MPTDTVIIRNTHWARVKVEALKGNVLPPNSNPSIGSRVLSLGGTWVIYSEGEDIYYRRDADPDHPDGSMTVYTHRPCYGNGQTYEEPI